MNFMSAVLKWHDIALRKPFVLLTPEPCINTGWKKTVSPLSIDSSTYGWLSNPRTPWYILLTPFCCCNYLNLSHSYCINCKQQHCQTSHLPFRIIMLQKYSFMRSRQNNKTSVSRCNGFHGCPSTDNLVSWAEWKVVQILVKQQVVKTGQKDHLNTENTENTWWRGWREVKRPVSGGLLISIVCMARMFGPVKHET
jgi:hypothetical protein